MGLLIKLGIKSIGRNRLRSGLTILAVALCAAGVTVYGSLMSGVADMMLDSLMSQVGHLRIIHPKIAKNERLNTGHYFVDDVKKLRSTLSKLEGVKAVVPRINFGAFVQHEFKPAQEKAWLAKKQCAHTAPARLKKGEKKVRKQAPSPGQGFDPKAEEKLRGLSKKLIFGRMVKDKGREVVIGRVMAQNLHACIGSQLVFIGRTHLGEFSDQKLKVVGILNQGPAMVDKMFFVSLSMGQYFVDIPNQADSVLIFAKKLEQTDAIAKKIGALKLGKSAKLETWRSNALAKQMIPLLNAILIILGGLVVFIGGIGLLNTMMMSVLERQKEVGIMMALGLSPGKVASVFLVEGAVFGVVGGLVGVIFGVLASLPLIFKGISLGAEATAKMPFPMEHTFKGEFSIEAIVVGFLVGVFATVLGTLWPAFQASRLEPVETLRK